MKRIKTELWLNKKRLNKIIYTESLKSLEIYINPALKWIRQFKEMKTKLYRIISKLQSIPVSVANAYVFINMYLIIQVYFGCGIISITPK